MIFAIIYISPLKKATPSAIGKWHIKVCPLLKGGGGNLIVFYYPCQSEIWPYYRDTFACLISEYGQLLW